MKNSQGFKLAILLVFVIGFQKLIAQPQFVIEDKVVFLTGQSNAEAATAQAQKRQPKAEAGVIEDTVVFATSGGTQTLKLDSIHKRLTLLKRGQYEKAGFFKWFNAHPTSSLNIEGYVIVIMATGVAPKPLAEVRFARQKNNVWIDKKFNKVGSPTEVKSITYSALNRKADIETYSGYKFSLTIDATTGKVDVAKVLALPNTEKIANAVEVHIYRKAKLF